MKKQTAVEWLEQELRKPLFVMVRDAFNPAKAMEKEQIVDAYDNGAEEWTPIEYSDGQQYYNETFNQ
jgi:hypothetical protein